ncbi:hypothetical protein BDK51DRAFT_28588 [Blyttiomyces helicus]|uniref:Uncharacterized protein n=1 Tax=Blyttiomyces helicus TaxID=388810 RepID=A0A4P9WRD0_9FUNG|nr:hypothetical protein BDK51DRAFT_28588 [Blyttiomyces helicus]|eukprot:RKO93810.1 hypothetical protein BDK51DRAFT_28588 [Blyttiomyces helicus]
MRTRFAKIESKERGEVEAVHPESAAASTAARPGNSDECHAVQSEDAAPSSASTRSHADDAEPTALPPSPPTSADAPAAAVPSPDAVSLATTSTPTASDIGSSNLSSTAFGSTHGDSRTMPTSWSVDVTTLSAREDSISPSVGGSSSVAGSAADIMSYGWGRRAGFAPEIMASSAGLGEDAVRADTRPGVMSYRWGEGEDGAVVSSVGGVTGSPAAVGVRASARDDGRGGGASVGRVSVPLPDPFAPPPSETLAGGVQWRKVGAGSPAPAQGAKEGRARGAPALLLPDPFAPPPAAPLATGMEKRKEAAAAPSTAPIAPSPTAGTSQLLSKKPPMPPASRVTVSTSSTAASSSSPQRSPSRSAATPWPPANRVSSPDSPKKDFADLVAAAIVATNIERYSSDSLDRGVPRSKPPVGSDGDLNTSRSRSASASMMAGSGLKQPESWRKNSGEGVGSSKDLSGGASSGSLDPPATYSTPPLAEDSEDDMQDFARSRSGSADMDSGARRKRVGYGLKKAPDDDRRSSTDLVTFKGSSDSVDRTREDASIGSPMRKGLAHARKTDSDSDGDLRAPSMGRSGSADMTSRATLKRGGRRPTLDHSSSDSAANLHGAWSGSLPTRPPNRGPSRPKGPRAVDSDDDLRASSVSRSGSADLVFGAGQNRPTSGLKKAQSDDMRSSMESAANFFKDSSDSVNRIMAAASSGSPAIASWVQSVRKGMEDTYRQASDSEEILRGTSKGLSGSADMISGTTHKRGGVSRRKATEDDRYSSTDSESNVFGASSGSLDAHAGRASSRSRAPRAVVSDDDLRPKGPLTKAKLLTGAGQKRLSSGRKTGDDDTRGSTESGIRFSGDSTDSVDREMSDSSTRSASIESWVRSVREGTERDRDGGSGSEDDLRTSSRGRSASADLIPEAGEGAEQDSDTDSDSKDEEELPDTSRGRSASRNPGATRKRPAGTRRKTQGADEDDPWSEISVPYASTKSTPAAPVVFTEAAKVGTASAKPGAAPALATPVTLARGAASSTSRSSLPTGTLGRANAARSSTAPDRGSPHSSGSSPRTSRANLASKATGSLPRRQTSRSPDPASTRSSSPKLPHARSPDPAAPPRKTASFGGASTAGSPTPKSALKKGPALPDKVKQPPPPAGASSRLPVQR